MTEANKVPRRVAAKEAKNHIFGDRGAAPAGVGEKNNSDPLVAMAELEADMPPAGGA